VQVHDLGEAELEAVVTGGLERIAGLARHEGEDEDRVRTLDE